MKRVKRRAFCVILIALAVIAGMCFYVFQYSENGKYRALYFSMANSGSSGRLYDRNGTMLASFSATESKYSPDWLTRVSNYHVTGDYWGRSGSGILSSYWGSIQDFDFVTGTTQSTDSTLYLTVDSRLNAEAYQLLTATQKGAVMIVNYKTGEILCMVSSPSVDPLDSSEPQEGAYINRCLAARFVPGSVFKLITAAAAIENIPDLYERSFYCEGVYTVAGVDITCSGTHYTQSFEEAMANSCNCAFSRLAIILGQDTLVEYAKNYGFLDSHSVDGISTSAGSFPTEFIGDPELGWAGIGQSTDLMCPFSLVRFVSAIANDGIVCEPYIIETDAEPVLSRLVQSDTAGKLQYLMRNNVLEHYEEKVDFGSLPVCAKTGTAEVGDGTSHSWFTGYLDDPDHPYAFVVLVENAGGGLTIAGNLANELLQYAVSLDGQE